MRKRQEGKLEVLELKILAFTLGLTNMEKNEKLVYQRKSSG